MVFLFVVFLIGYVMVKNERSIEQFVDRIAGSPISAKDVTETQKETITSVFRNYLNRDPTPDELQQFVKVMMNPNDVLSLVDAVKATDEYKTMMIRSSNKVDNATGDIYLNAAELKDSPLLKDLKKVDFDERMDIYRTIIDVYQRVLDRMPTNKELTYYAHRMATDKAFTINRLTLILEGSNEYKILQKNQSNEVNGQLPGNITHAQLVLDVTTKYQSIYNREPSQETLDFLIKKYIEYKLDEAKFDRLLMLMNTLDEDQYIKTSDGSIEVKLADGTSLQNQITNRKNTEPQLSDNNFETTTEEFNKKTQSANVVNINIISPSSEDIDAIVDKLNSTAASQGNTQTIINKAAKLPPSPNQNTDEFSDPFYKALAKSQASRSTSCKFNPDVNFNRDKMSDYQARRNQEEVAFACKRNTYYDNIDPDIAAAFSAKTFKRQIQKKDFDAQPVVYSYEPENSTPLTEARQTHVGSILPAFIYNDATP